ncbi:MAG: hypothetical protein QM677_01415 [Microbacterium sp.]
MLETGSRDEANPVEGQHDSVTPVTDPPPVATDSVAETSADVECASSRIPAEEFPGLRVEVASVTWERVWVTLDFSFSEPPPSDVDFAIFDTLRAYPLTVERLDDTSYRARINVTNFRSRQQVPNGSWRFMAVIGGRRGPIAGYPLRRAAELDSSGRSYLYNKNRSTYVVTFGLTKDERAHVIMRTYQLNRPTPKGSGSSKRKEQ